MSRLGMIAILAPALLAASSGANHASFVVVSESGVGAYAEVVDHMAGDDYLRSVCHVWE